MLHASPAAPSTLLAGSMFIPTTFGTVTMAGAVVVVTAGAVVVGAGVELVGATVCVAPAVVAAGALGAVVVVVGDTVVVVGVGATVVGVADRVADRCTITFAGCDGPPVAMMPPIPPPIRTTSPSTAALAAFPVSLQNVLIPQSYA